MSNYLPFEIQVEFIRRLPIKSVLQFRSVSKAWKSLIDSSEFIASYRGGHTQPQRLLLRYEEPVENKKKYVCFVDDATFPQQTFTPIVPMTVQLCYFSMIIGSSHGLLCFLATYAEPGESSDTRIVSIWNPSIRKSVAIEVPITLSYREYSTVLGFGVCPVTKDPKILRITLCATCITWPLEVYTLSSGAWTTPSANLPRESISISWSQEAIDRYIYFRAYDKIANNGRSRNYNLIMAFDLTSEEFKEIYLPDSLADHGIELSLSKLRESLVVFASKRENESHDVWLMEDGVPNSFTKMFKVKAPYSSIHGVLGFRENGEPILEVKSEAESASEMDVYEPYLIQDNNRRTALAVYEPYSEQLNNLGINGDEFYVESYTETLLLLNLRNNGNESSFVESYNETLVLLNHPDFRVRTNEDDG